MSVVLFSQRNGNGAGTSREKMMPLLCRSGLCREADGLSDCGVCDCPFVPTSRLTQLPQRTRGSCTSTAASTRCLPGLQSLEFLAWPGQAQRGWEVPFLAESTWGAPAALRLPGPRKVARVLNDQCSNDYRSRNASRAFSTGLSRYSSTVFSPVRISTEAIMPGMIGNSLPPASSTLLSVSTVTR